LKQDKTVKVHGKVWMNKRGRAWVWEWRACAKNRNADTNGTVPEMYTRAGTSQISIKGTPEQISARKKIETNISV
jgi:hypothetical protein